jgi:DnaA regulatory inactivator Hda
MPTKNQMALNFPTKVDFSAENFMENSGNSKALQTIQSLENNGDIAVIYGKEGCGKSHLTSLWKNDVNAINLHEIDLFTPEITHVYVEDLDTLTSAQQEHLFHAFNHIKNVKGALLVTSHIPPAQLDLLADLKSRLLLGEQVEISLPNPQELTVLLSKWAYDRQLELSPEVIQYLLKRCERSPKVLEACIAKLDTLSLEQKRRITVPLAREALEI